MDSSIKNLQRMARLRDQSLGFAPIRLLRTVKLKKIKKTFALNQRLMET
jgi:hypothetical protein